MLMSYPENLGNPVNPCSDKLVTSCRSERACDLRHVNLIASDMSEVAPLAPIWVSNENIRVGGRSARSDMGIP